MLAFVLILWCAGTGCMLVTYARGTEMTGADSTSDHAAMADLSDASASAQSSGCPFHHDAKPTAAVSPSRRPITQPQSTTRFDLATLPEGSAPSGAMSCCPLMSGSFVVASRANSNDANDSALAQTDSVSRSLTKFQPAPRAYPLRLP